MSSAHDNRKIITIPLQYFRSRKYANWSLRKINEEIQAIDYIFLRTWAYKIPSNWYTTYLRYKKNVLLPKHLQKSHLQQHLLSILFLQYHIIPCILMVTFDLHDFFSWRLALHLTVAHFYLHYSVWSWHYVHSQ